MCIRDRAIDTLHAIPNRNLILLAEGSRADHFNAGFDLNYAWDFYGAIKNAFNGQSAKGAFLTHTNEYNVVPAGKHLLRFTTNHDQSAWESTPMVLFKGKQGALAASVATIFMEGVPLFYTGQEVGRAVSYTHLIAHLLHPDYPHPDFRIIQVADKSRAYSPRRDCRLRQ